MLYLPTTFLRYSFFSLFCSSSLLFSSFKCCIYSRVSLTPPRTAMSSCFSISSSHWNNDFSLISLYVFFHIFGYFFKKRNESRNEGNATAESGENGNVVSAESLREVYMAVIALGLNRAMGNHDEESGIITIKSCRSNWNPRISG